MLGVFRVNERTREIYGRIFRSEIWEALGQLLDGGRSINVPLGQQGPLRMRVVDYWISLIAAILGQVFRRNFIIQFSGTLWLKCEIPLITSGTEFRFRFLYSKLVRRKNYFDLGKFPLISPIESGKYFTFAIFYAN